MIKNLTHVLVLKIQGYVSFFVWLLLPTLILFASRGTSYEGQFRAQPYNDAYDSMFVFACFGCSATRLTNHWFFLRRLDEVKNKLPIFFSFFNSFNFFEVFLMFILSILYFVIGCNGSGFLWLFFAIICTIIEIKLFLFEKKQDESLIDNSRIEESNPWIRWPYSVLISLFAIGFIAFPVSQSWVRPEPFVRWHPFSIDGELVWRGIFGSFALAMILTAFQPLRRHMVFTLNLFFSGFLHSSLMLVFNLVERSNGGRNGNSEHLYGDIVGWYFISLLSGLVFLLDGFYIQSVKKLNGEKENTFSVQL